MTNELYEKEEKYIEFLKNKNLKIEYYEENYIKLILYKEGYASLIENYEEIFWESKISQKFRSEINFNSIKALYDFDKNIKNIYFKYISKIEHQIKTIIANTFISFHDNLNYFKIDNYEIHNLYGYIDSNKVKKVLELISKLESTLASKIDKNEKILNLFVKYGFVPFEDFINYLTFGEVSTFYKSMKEKERNNIAKIFDLKPEDFTIYLKILTKARNKCAHDDVFFNFQYSNAIKCNNIKNFEKLNIPYVEGNYLYGTSDLFALTIIICLLLDKNSVDELISLIDLEFLRLKENISSEIIYNIKLKMGFNEYWKNVVKLK